MLKSFALLIIQVYIILLIAPFSTTKTSKWDTNCFQPQYLKTEWIDSCPKYCLNISYSKEGTLNSFANVTEVVQVPIAHFAISQTDADGRRYTLCNITARLCDIKDIVGRIPMLNSIMQSLKSSNYTFQCPIATGIHNLTNMRINPRNPFLLLMYRQKTQFTVSGGMSKELPDKSRTRLTAYNITAKIIKRPCDCRKD